MAFKIFYWKLKDNTGVYNEEKTNLKPHNSFPRSWILCHALCREFLSVFLPLQPQQHHVESASSPHPSGNFLDFLLCVQNLILLSQTRKDNKILSFFFSYKEFISFGETTILTMGNVLAMVHIIAISCGWSGYIIRFKSFEWWGIISGLGRRTLVLQGQAKTWKKETCYLEVCS